MAPKVQKVGKNTLKKYFLTHFSNTISIIINHIIRLILIEN